MPSTFGQWLIVILALLVGLGGGWALWGRQKPAATSPIVEGDPVVGLSAEEKAAAATIDTPRPIATVDTSPAPAAVVDQPTPHTAPDTDHAAPATDSTTLTADSTADSTASTISTADSTVDEHAITAVDGTPTTIAAERSAPLADIDDESTTADLTGRTVSDEKPASTDADETVAPVPAPRATVEDTPDTPGTATALPQPTTVDPDGPAASSTETGADPLAAPSAETTQPAEPAIEPAAAEPAAEPAVAEPAIESVAAEPAIEPVAAEPATQVATVADGESTMPASVPDPDLSGADDVDTAPVAVAPAVPAQRTSVEDTAPAAEDTPVPAAAPLSDASPTQGGSADDFRRIQGVGPKMAAALQSAGIHTYQQLAALDETGLRETIRAAGLRATASLATWPQQAKVLAGAGAEAERVLPTPTGGDTRD
ncbi:hypothetical protein [Micromonospora sp. RL09-050-HVF-A]|uniref:hypothetical protein n=1 Tax=Micromonospora sp. RL09-050-HVF-A TaxID=1703433 RepID=UPI0035AB9D39